MYTKDKVEKMEPSAEVKEKEEEGEADEEDGDDEEQEDRGDKEKEEEAMPQAADKIEKNIPLPIQPREKKQAEGLNLNNEVVKMRKEVKRVRALIIRKLTRQIGGLKKKKGTETEKERNQRRAARLLEEIHAMKVLLPDLVTKTALQKNLNFEQECKNPKSTISDRAVARIATHPQFNKKIKDIKAAVNAFKQERMKGGQQGGNEKVQNKAGKVTPQSPDKKGERQSKKEEEDITVEQKEIIDNEEGDGVLKDASVAKPGKEPGKATRSADTADTRRKEMPQNERPASIKSSEVKDIVKNKPQSKYAEKRPDHTSAPEVLQKKKDEEESDLELSDDEEKEYFDDSTEERFHKQSSQSEESDDDDFFVGRVSKFKKKRQKSKEGESVGKGHEVKADPTDQVQSRLDELESRLMSKGSSLQSVFCSSLSASKPGGGRGAGRGRGGDTFRGQGKPKGGRGLNRDFSKQSKFQNQEKDTERKPGSKYSKPRPEGRHPELAEKGFPSGRGRGRGRGDAFRQKDHRGGGAFSHQAPQQALHPSWEASKKRKEQQGQILAFQGKKIKFDDND